MVYMGQWTYNAMGKWGNEHVGQWPYEVLGTSSKRHMQQSLLFHLFIAPFVGQP